MEAQKPSAVGINNRFIASFSFETNSRQGVNHDRAKNLCMGNEPSVGARIP